MLTGCPDPHLKLAVAGARDVVEDPCEKAWRAGCYVGPYEICTASMIWHNWPIWDVVDDPGFKGFSNWIEDTWPNWQIRRERRAARTVRKMTESLLSYANFVVNILPENNHLEYDELWELADSNIKYFGRYALIKLLETLYRGNLVTHNIPDIRPIGGWSPRQTMGLLDPDNAFVYNKGGNKTKALGLIKEQTDTIQKELSDYIGEQISYYNVEVLLCNYRQHVKHHSGWPLDSDLKYYQLFKEKNGEPPFEFLRHRSELFPHEVLGEIQGWDVPREDIGECFVKQGYHWNDVIYDYNASKEDLAHPVLR